MTDVEIGYGGWKALEPFLGQKTVTTNTHSQSLFFIFMDEDLRLPQTYTVVFTKANQDPTS